MFKENKMDANNLAIVFAPNVVDNDTAGCTDYSEILTEMEMNQRLVEKLIIYSTEIFK